MTSDAAFAFRISLSKGEEDTTPFMDMLQWCFCKEKVEDQVGLQRRFTALDHLFVSERYQTSSVVALV